MITVSVIGSGNVAFHLISALRKAKDVHLVQVCARHADNISSLVAQDQIVADPGLLQPVDLCLIAVSDDAISAVSAAIPFRGSIVAHTSGSVSIDVLASTNHGAVFYPLQTFSKTKPVDFADVPICLESARKEDYAVLEKVAYALSRHVEPISSSQRKALHVAAVFVCNFVNQLYQIGFEICQEHHVSFDILKPLIRETAEKINTLQPLDAQTGPAKRKDSKTIASHLALLEEGKKKMIYTLMTQTIQSYE